MKADCNTDEWCFTHNDYSDDEIQTNSKLLSDEEMYEGVDKKKKHGGGDKKHKHKHDHKKKERPDHSHKHKHDHKHDHSHGKKHLINDPSPQDELLEERNV